MDSAEPTVEELTQKIQDEFGRAVVRRVRERARASLLEVLVLNLGDHDIMLLSALGVDARAVFLQALTEEAKLLIEEDTHDPERTA